MGGTCYAVAFDGDGFLMVRNTRRGGWEMPGGHVEPGETPEQAVEREFLEESGYRISIVASRDLGGGVTVFAAILGEKASERAEMGSRVFTELPDELSFGRDEYEDTVPWALSAVRRRRGTDGGPRAPSTPDP